MRSLSGTHFFYPTMKNKFFKWLLLYLTICIPLFFSSLLFLNCQGTTEIKYREEIEVKVEPRIYVTTYGEKYHSRDCSYLQSIHAKGLYEAKKQGYTACSRCGGKANGTIEVKHLIKIPYEVERPNVRDSLQAALVLGLIIYGCIKWWKWYQKEKEKEE